MKIVLDGVRDLRHTLSMPVATRTEKLAALFAHALALLVSAGALAYVV